MYAFYLISAVSLHLHSRWICKFYSSLCDSISVHKFSQFMRFWQNLLCIIWIGGWEPVDVACVLKQAKWQTSPAATRTPRLQRLNGDKSAYRWSRCHQTALHGRVWMYTNKSTSGRLINEWRDEWSAQARCTHNAASIKLHASCDYYALIDRTRDHSSAESDCMHAGSKAPHCEILIVNASSG